jgi:WD40 repeat protein
LASADRENVLTLRDTAGKPLWTHPSGHDRFILALAFAPDGRMLASVGTDTTVRLWEVVRGTERATLSEHATAVSAVAFAPDGRTLATGDRAGIVKLWDVATVAERLAVTAAAPSGGSLESTPQRGVKFVEEVTALAFTPDGRTLAVAADQTVQLWDVATGSCVARLAGHEAKVQCLACSPDGKLLASGGHDRAVRLWDVARYQAKGWR